MAIHRFVFALVGTALALQAQAPDFTPPTPLMGALLRNDTAEAKRLLAAGADPNEAKFLGAPPIFLALMERNDAVARVMIEKGADVKATDAAGSTTLMWAAANESADPDMVKLLIERGVDPNATNKMGESALSWALRRGYTPMVQTLKQHGATESVLVKQSVEKALALLQKSGPEFVKVSGCVSCHHQSLPQMASAMARERGFTVDPQFEMQQSKAVMAMIKPLREAAMQDKVNLPDPAVSVSYLMVGLAAVGYPPDENTHAMARLVAREQMKDGGFTIFPARPPIESSAITATALSLRALQAYGTDADSKIAAARNWLRLAKPQNNEERSMQLLGLAWSGVKGEELKKLGQALVAEQRADGGWAQLPTLESDAYATGQALVALYTAGQLRSTDKAYEAGVAYLLRTQHADGSWLVRSRAFPFQKYRESGFPHGKDQWISASGTSWAAMALSLTAERVDIYSDDRR